MINNENTARAIIESTSRHIPFSPPDITNDEIEEVVKAMQSGWITTGQRTKQFEQEIANYVGTAKAVALNSATAALELTLRILGVGAGDEVITSAYTYTASAAVIDHVGAKIVLVDTAPGSYEMDYDRLADAISEKTKVIIPVDLAGKMCDYDRIFEVVEAKRGLFCPGSALQKLFNRIIVVADSAHGFGAERHGLMSGQAADFTCFSFHAVKNLTTAEGGAVVWRDVSSVDGRPRLDHDQLYKQYMLYSMHGQSKDALAKNRPDAWEYDIVHLGYKYNMTDIMAGIGLVQLKRYNRIMLLRRNIIAEYDRALLPLGVNLVKHYEHGRSSGHLYLVRVPGISKEQRNEIIVRMAQDGVTTNVHYKPLPMMTAYKELGFDIRDYPHAYAQYQNEITLPLHTRLSAEDVKYVCDSFKRAMGEVVSRDKRHR